MIQIQKLTPYRVILLLALGVTSPLANAGLTPMEQLGKKLFFDAISQPANQSCASCHSSKAGWTGQIAGANIHGAVYRGAQRQRFGNRKPPTTAYAPFSPIFHLDTVQGVFVGGMLWDGRATGENLGNPAADQALGPFLVDPVEQNMPSKQAVCEVIAASKYADLFEEVWGPGSLDCSDTGVDAMFDRVGLSIATYEASHEVSPFDSVFDDYWRACLDAGNDPEDCGKAEGDKATLDPTGILNDQEFDGLIEFGEYCSAVPHQPRPRPRRAATALHGLHVREHRRAEEPREPLLRMDEVLCDDGNADQS